MNEQTEKRDSAYVPAPRGQYIYAVVAHDERQPSELRGLADRPVYTIAHHGMAAVVSNIDTPRVRPQRSNLAAHRAVLNGLMSSFDAVLPMRFGAIASNAGEIRRMLTSNRELFAQRLEQIAGKLEMGVRVVWDVPNIFEYMVDRHPELRAERDRLFRSAAKPSPEDRVELGRLFERLREEDRLTHIALVEEELEPRCAAIKRAPARDEREVMNLACLVARNGRDQFEQGVFMAAAHFDNNFAFDYNGPWPPHTFAEINIKD